jgi:spectinomycin phosphotransferase
MLDELVTGKIATIISMIEKQAFPDEQIIACLKSDYGFDVAKLTFLPLGADADASVYKAEMDDQKVYFVKLKRGHDHDNGVTIARLLFDFGIGEIIPPIKTIVGSPIQRLGAFSLIVYPFVEGQDGFSRQLPNEHWIALGKALRRVHDIHVPQSVEDKVRRESYSGKWRETVRGLYANIPSQGVGDKITSKLVAYMKEHAATIHRLVDRSEQLARLVSNRPANFVLCHSDIHGGNVLIDLRGAFYIVDWDEPIMAPKERDLMFIGGGVGNVWNKPHEEELFYEGYGKTHVDMVALAYYRYERIVEDIALYGQDLLLTTAGGENRLASFKFFVAMFEPQGAVDMAFKADRNI